MELWSDNGQSTHLPSTLLATFVSSQNWNTVYSAAQNPTSTITFNSSGFGQNYSISSGTTYWIVVSSTAGSAKAWGVRSGSDIGDTATYAALSGPWSSASLAGSLGMSLSVQSAIPEPGTYALFAGLCTLGVTIVLRRRRHPRLPTASR